MATLTPTWTDNVSVIAAQVLVRTNTVRGTLDLRTKFGAYLFARIGRGGTATLTNGVDLLVRRVLNNGGAGGGHPGGLGFTSSSPTVAANSSLVNANSNSGQPAITLVSTTGFAVGDIVCIQDSGGGVTRLEWHRVAKLTATVLTFDTNLEYTHTDAQDDTVRNKADAFAPIWLDGGSLWEVIFDYSDDAAGDDATVQALAQTYDSMTSV